MRVLLTLCAILLVACGAAGEAAEQTTPYSDQQHLYDLTLSAKAETSGQNGEAQTTVDFSLRGHMRVAPLSVKGTDRQVLLTLESPELTSKLEAAPEKVAALAVELGQTPVILTFRAGKVVETRLPSTVDSFVGGVLLTVAGSLQYPDPLPSSPVEQQEQDATGQYTVRYSPSEVRGELRKTKLAYVPLATASAAMTGFDAGTLAPKVQSSSGTLDIDGQTLRGGTFDETVFALVLNTATFKTRTQLSFKLIQTSTPSTHDVPALMAKTSRYQAGKPFFKQSTKRPLDALRVSGRSFEEIVAAVLKSEQDPVALEFRKGGDESTLSSAEVASRKRWLEQSTEAFGALVSCYREDPQATAKAIALVREGSPVSDALLQGLAAASTPEAQHALVEAMHDSQLPAPKRTRVIMSLLRVKQPTAEGARALEVAMDDPLLGTYAIYGVGTYARRFRDTGDVVTADRLSNALIKRLRPETEPSLAIHLLRGIANGGDVRALEAVRPYLASEDELVRSAAVQALQLMKDPRVDGIIIGQMSDTKAVPDVRIAALDAARLRPTTPALVSAVAARALGDRSKSVKFSAIRLLAQWQGAFPAATAALRKVSATEADAATRELAGNSLTR